MLLIVELRGRRGGGEGKRLGGRMGGGIPLEVPYTKV